MSDKPEDEEGGANDADFRRKLQEDGFKADSSGMRFAAAQPKVLVAGAYKVIRTAAEKAREVLGRER